MKHLRSDIHISFAFDRNYLVAFFVAITSVFLNNKRHRIVIHAITSGVDETTKGYIKNYVGSYRGEICFYEISKVDLEGFVVPQQSYFSIAIYYRLFLPLMISSDIEKILYFDTDVIIKGDLLELYSQDLNNFAVGAALDNQMDIRTDLGIYESADYFNSGVLLINAKSWRTNCITQRTVQYILQNSKLTRFPDQDALNVILKNNWHRLDQKWNVMRQDIPVAIDVGSRKYLFGDMVIHFNDRFKPWEISCDHKLKHVYNKYALRFFRSEIVATLINIDLNFALENVIANVFQESGIDLGKNLLCAFSLHVCWIKVLKVTYSKDRINELLQESYLYDDKPITSILFDELAAIYKQNNKLLIKIYSEIFKASTPVEIRTDWLRIWFEACSYVTRHLAENSNVGKTNSQLAIPNLINRRMEISPTKKIILNYLIENVVLKVAIN